MTGKRRHPTNAKRHFKRTKYSDGGASKLEVGMVGVLVSHDRNREKSCRLDCFRLLNHFADKLYGPEKVEEKAKDEKSDDDSFDIESAMSTEISDIKGNTERKSYHQRRFSSVKSGCNNLVFVRFLKISPSELMKNIVENISTCENLEESEIPGVRNVLRVHPVEFTTSAYLDNMCKNIPQFLEKKFSEMSKVETKEFTIDYKCRNNSHLSRQTVLDGLIKELKDSPSGWKYNCRTQAVSVIIDVLKTVCMVSVVQDYFAYKKYNIRELLQKTIPQEPQPMMPESEIKSDDDGKKVEAGTQESNGKDEKLESPSPPEEAENCESRLDETSCDRAQNQSLKLPLPTEEAEICESKIGELSCDRAQNQSDERETGDGEAPVFLNELFQVKTDSTGALSDTNGGTVVTEGAD